MNLRKVSGEIHLCGALAMFMVALGMGNKAQSKILRRYTYIYIFFSPLSYVAPLHSPLPYLLVWIKTWKGWWKGSRLSLFLELLQLWQISGGLFFTFPCLTWPQPSREWRGWAPRVRAEWQVYASFPGGSNPSLLICVDTREEEEWLIPLGFP